MVWSRKSAASRSITSKFCGYKGHQDDAKSLYRLLLVNVRSYTYRSIDSSSLIPKFPVFYPI